MGESRRKLSRHATNNEIFPGTHGPVQNGTGELMRGIIEILKDTFGENFDVTLFVAERNATGGQDRLPRFNYISTAAREDMFAVLRAFLAKNEQIGASLDKINDAPAGSA